ncbi:MAG: twin-arginine translocation signal protein [Clostridiales bacterium]|jgi:hypothetical protein|nr:twin-arginine translocation signal protein [Clostridiales bacterium]
MQLSQIVCQETLSANQTDIYLRLNKGTPFLIEAERMSAKMPYLGTESIDYSFEAGHGWVKTGSGEITDDQTIFESNTTSTQSIKLTPVTGTAVNAQKTSLSLDYSDQRHIRLWAYADPANINNLSKFEVMYCTGAATYSYDFLPTLKLKNPCIITIAKPDFFKYLEPNWANIDRIIIKVTANAEVTGSVWVDNLGWQKPKPTKGKIIIRFDDGLKSVFSTAAASMMNWGVTGCCVVTPARVGINENYMTLDDLSTLKTRGWDISSHSFDHANNATFGDKAFSYCYNDSKATQNWLLEKGFTNGARFHAFPGNAHNSNTLLATSQIFTLINSGVIGHETLPWADGILLKRLSGDLKTAAELNAYADVCAANKTLAIIYFHNIVLGGASYTTDPAEFVSFISTLGARNDVDVITYSDLLDTTYIATR